jgi:hypothetical protein
MVEQLSDRSSGDNRMHKALIGAGALLLATAAVPASAHDWGDNNNYGNYDNNYGSNNYGNGYNSGYGYRDYNRGPDYDTIRWHVRACRQHERFHQTLNHVHEEEHEQGVEDSDHRDVHQALNEAHQEYHDNHPGAENCGYWYSQYYRWNHGGYGRSYYRYNGYSNRDNGYSNGNY